MTGNAPLVFRHYGLADARAVRGIVEKIYRDSYSEERQEDSFSSGGRFMGRFDAYTAIPGFELVVACTEDGEPAGQAWGWPLSAESKWWTGLVAEPEPGFTREDGTRTFALSEIMVRRPCTGRGIAHALHDELLRDRSEERATLLVRPANTFAYRAYTRWGWRAVAQVCPPWPDAPMFDVLMLPLHVG
jgi:GNAT superfamily N-acetyltransferase